MSKTVCIFAGARGKEYLMPATKEITSLLVRSGWDLIYGGSSRGVMGQVCSTVKELGGKITGVLPQKIYELQHFDKEIDTLVAETMASRKQMFWDRSDAYLALPGAYGTLDEIGEVLTLTKLGYLEPKPIVIFNQDGFYDPLRRLFQNMQDCGLMGSDRANLAQFADTPEEAVALINGQPIEARSGAWRF